MVNTFNFKFDYHINDTLNLILMIFISKRKVVGNGINLTGGIPILLEAVASLGVLHRIEGTRCSWQNS